MGRAFTNFFVYFNTQDLRVSFFMLTFAVGYSTTPGGPRPIQVYRFKC